MQIDRIKKAKQRRAFSTRRKVFGTPERPRLTVFRSGRHIYAQIIDDVAGVTLATASTLSKDIREATGKTGDKTAAATVGSSVAKQALGVGIKCVCFDRGQYQYHGRVKELADSARKAGLAF